MADSAARQPEPTPSGAVMTHRQILFVIFGLMAGMFLSSLDQTIVGTSMRTIADDLDGLSQQAWVTTAYLIVSTIATPIYGKLSDIFGRRPLYLIAIVLFLIGSLLAGFATSMLGLAGFRAVQGLGAGGLMSLALTVMGDILPPRERAKYQGYFLAVFGVSSVVGPLIGGLLAGTPEILFITGWRWVFLINLPIGAVALVIVLRFLHLPKPAGVRSVRIDWWGAALVVIAAGPLLLIAEQGREWGWGSPIAWVCYVVGALGIVGFIAAERMMGDDALIPLKLFRSPTFSMATVLGVLVGFGMFGGMMTIPLYLQLVNGATPTESGFLMLPMILGLMIASIVSGQIISRTGRYRAFPIVGTFLMSAAFFYFTFVSIDKPVLFMMGGMLMLGLGLGQMMQTLTLASQNSVDVANMGVATSASTFFRQIGGTLGTAVIFSVLFTRIPDTIAAAFRKPGIAADLQTALADPSVVADPANAKILELLQSQDSSAIGSALDGDTSFLNTADPALSAPFLTGFNDATVTVFTVALGVVLLAFVLSWFLRTPPLRAKSAMQEAHDLAQDDARAQDDAQAQEQRTAEDLRRSDPQLAARAGADLAAGSIEPDVRTDAVRAERPGADETQGRRRS
ncbi:MFS transporter [Rathayibacter sp. ZW T2_19]|uniref:MFS transporter n=1 Tax=Rathayibacter rubneri TaxID=2950106 RepID=A0A9X2E0Y3_9MICO|nr:MDR family MFS transporter [Rathayibacter rubneri]MCM6764303.1 MFS transporter [Rathayibacter rubneri]